MPKRAPVHFLIADDLADNLLSLDALLRREDLVILKAQSGRAALELLLEYDVALAFLDVQMPGMDGFELAELMRGMDKTRQVPIIFLTAGVADYQRRFRGYEAGAVDFLQKPVEPDIVRSKAQVFFDLYRQRQEVATQRDELRAIAEENSRLLAESQAYLKALQAVDRRKGEFLATLAHELRNPLAPISNGLALLHPPEGDAEAREVKAMMTRQLAHLVRLIDDLLDVSRVSHGKIELKKETVSFQSALRSAAEAGRALVETNGHHLTIDVPAEPLWVSADPIRLAQIVGNLLNNAAKYTPQGGKLAIKAASAGGELVVAVSDNGIGIAAEMLPRIFDLFTQAESDLAHARGGLGIGLALVRQLVTMHGGTVTAGSKGKGLGSTFTVRLPLAAPPASAAPQPAEVSQSAGGADMQRILVVDDNVDSAKTTGWMLEAMGHDYKLAHDGEAALETAKTYQPTVIMLDIGLPKIDGYEVCRRLRADPAFKNVYLIAQTGWGQKKDRLLAEQAGFDYHLVKPVDMDRLSALIRDARAQRRPRAL